MNTPLSLANAPRIRWPWPARTIMVVALLSAVVLPGVINAVTTHSVHRHGIVSYSADGTDPDSIWLTHLGTQMNLATAHGEAPELLDARNMNYEQQMDVLAAAMCGLPAVNFSPGTVINTLPFRQMMVTSSVSSLGDANNDYAGVYNDFTERVWNKCLMLSNGLRFSTIAS